MKAFEEKYSNLDGTDEDLVSNMAVPRLEHISPCVLQVLEVVSRCHNDLSILHTDVASHKFKVLQFVIMFATICQSEKPLDFTREMLGHKDPMRVT